MNSTCTQYTPSTCTATRTFLAPWSSSNARTSVLWCHGTTVRTVRTVRPTLARAAVALRGKLPCASGACGAQEVNTCILAQFRTALGRPVGTCQHSLSPEQRRRLAAPGQETRAGGPQARPTSRWRGPRVARGPSAPGEELIAAPAAPSSSAAAPASARPSASFGKGRQTSGDARGALLTS